MRRHLARSPSLALAVAALLGACGDDNTVDVQQTPTIGVTLAAPTLALTLGQSGTVNVTVARGGGYTGPVSLTLVGAPAGVTGSFNPASVGSGATASVLTVGTGTPATAGTYNLTVRAEGTTGVTAVTAPLTLTINPAPSIGVTLAASTLAVTQGQSGTVSVAIARNGGFAGAVDLTVEGAPAGVTASFNPASVGSGVSASVLSVSAAATVAPGTYNLTVRGQGTGISPVTVPLALTVNAAPTIAVAIAPTSLSIAQGANATATLTLTRGGGFAGPVDVTVEGLPANVTASASPATIAAGSTTSTITVAAGAAAAVGPSTLTVRVSGQGVTAQTVQLPIAITAAPTVPAYTLALTPTAATVQQNGTATVSVAVTRTGGFTGGVTLALEGAPTGVTGTFSPNPATENAATLTLTAAATAATGAFSATVRGTATGLADRTTTLSITVSPATPAGGYTLSVTPATVTVQQGQSGTATVSLARTGGFTGPVTITTSGAPTGLTVTGPAAPVTDNSAALAIAAASTLAPGTYAFTVTGAAAGLANQTATVNVTVTAAPAASVSLGVTPATVNVAAGGTATSTLNITRAGGFAGAVAVTTSGAPAGLTVTPASASTTDPSVTLTVAAAATVAPGTYPVTITGTGTGVANATTTLNVTVTAAAGFSVALTPTTFTLQQGTSTTLTVNLTRAGGFAGTVDLAASGLPSGVTASFSPSGITGLSSTLTLTASATAATGAFTLTVTGASAGLPNATATASGNVTASSGGGNVPLAFCQDAVPVWVGYQTSPTAPWVRATVSASGTANVPVTGSQGAIAYVIQSGTAYTLNVVYGAAADLGTLGASACQAAPGGKTLTGSVAGLSGPTDQALISLGSATASASGANLSYTLNNVPSGPRDLLATRTAIAIGAGGVTSTLDKLILRRSLNLPSGGTIPVLDFNSAEAFAPASANVTVAGAGTDIFFPIVSYVTANGTGGSFFNGAFGALGGGGAPPATQRYFGVPADRQVAGDFHSMYVFAAPQSATGFDATSARAAGIYFRAVSDRTVTLGPVLATPTVGLAATTPYPRPRVQLTRQSEYGDAMAATFSQAGAGVATRTASILVLSSYTGGGNWDATLPDLTGAEFDPTWALRPGTTINWSVNAWGGSLVGFVGGQPAEGSTFRFAVRSGTLSAAARAVFRR